jgi:hypothetical protein
MIGLQSRKDESRGVSELAKDNPRGAGDLDRSDDSSETSHAADEPTAVWDIDALRKAGLSEVIDAPETPASAPATPAVGMEVERPSMIVEQEPTRPSAPRPAPAPAAPRRAAIRRAAQSDVGWVGLITMAALLGAIAYVVMRLLR